MGYDARRIVTTPRPRSRVAGLLGAVAVAAWALALALPAQAAKKPSEFIPHDAPHDEQCAHSALMRSPSNLEFGFRRNAAGERRRRIALSLYTLPPSDSYRPDVPCEGQQTFRLWARQKSTPGPWKRGKWTRISQMLTVVPEYPADGPGYNDGRHLLDLSERPSRKVHTEVVVEITWAAEGESQVHRRRYYNLGGHTRQIDKYLRNDQRNAKGGRPIR
ncbi:MAG TPA: hypothetical protein VFQ14_06240 [Thermoleophilaceae bacterium]|nr:hypothetical protein [Thermoleophilaceae bacterium]